MPDPQQPELRRSGNTPVTGEPLPGGDATDGGGGLGPIPPDNAPGAHPGDQSDIPDLEAFRARFGGGHHDDEDDAGETGTDDRQSDAGEAPDAPDAAEDPDAGAAEDAADPLDPVEPLVAASVPVVEPDPDADVAETPAVEDSAIDADAFSPSVEDLTARGAADAFSPDAEDLTGRAAADAFSPDAEDLTGRAAAEQSTGGISGEESADRPARLVSTDDPDGDLSGAPAAHPDALDDLDIEPIPVAERPDAATPGGPRSSPRPLTDRDVDEDVPVGAPGAAAFALAGDEAPRATPVTWGLRLTAGALRRAADATEHVARRIDRALRFPR